MSRSYWRSRAAPIIAAVIKEVGIEDEKLLRSRLRAVYPFGPKDHHPYMVWLSEIKNQVAGAKGMSRLNNMKPKPADPAQLNLEEETSND